MVPLPAVPLQAPAHVIAQVALQVPVGEDGRAAVDLVDGQATEQAREQLLLDLVGRRAAGDGRPQEFGRQPQDRADHGPGAA